MFHFGNKILNVPSFHFYEISAIFFQCCFIIERQVLMTVSNFSGVFLGIISWKGALLFNGGSLLSWGGGFIFKWRGCPMGGSAFTGGGVQKKSWDGGHPQCTSPLWETLNMLSSNHVEA